MPSQRTQIAADVGHILFIDLVGNSKLPTHVQHESLHKLSEALRNTEAFVTSDTEGHLLQLSTGNGFALVFANTQDAPVRCAMQLAKQLRSSPKLRVRMGIHNGPVSRVIGINDKLSVVGAGLNTARLITDCGEAGHIILSKRAVDDLADSWRLRSCLHDLGELETTSGATISAVNFYTKEIGNPAIPAQFKRPIPKKSAPGESVRLSPLSAQNTLLTILFFSVVAVAIGYWIFFPPPGSNSGKNASGPQVQVLTATSEGGNRSGAENHPTPSQRITTQP